MIISDSIHLIWFCTKMHLYKAVHIQLCSPISAQAKTLTTTVKTGRSCVLCIWELLGLA